ncbi:Methionyl-tRNA formyltransferase [Didymosphaeria variabile]|uniref:methionyl-tRNA formyltransferase n=1 Tax=Didymosphaeria variabile TaxID=1932322 RepID=A0A9W8XTZ1_9PLEO|nr:Methionyl-tRNA formyltransferase [Didymosphaeria variabile]KAJ4357630.1 Methionyl-tRNA formyltransferase [Didymosphaeria variabile]
MLWRLPASVRSLLVPSYRRFGSSSAATVPPLRILFCGSDDFSIASLRALSQAQKEVPKLIESIDVVHRPGKRTGRGLKTLRNVPIKLAAAEELCVTHTIDTFTGWTPPSRVDLIIAVSFGLFVPPRILNLAKYGGLNVHPSLLPDLKGPAPIQHALLKRRQYTGVSVQTLHPSQFDGGTILAQTPSPGVTIPDLATADDLTRRLAFEGADMLVNVLKTRAFVPPLKDIGWYKDSGGPIDHAGKVMKGDQQVDFSKTTLEDVFAIKRAIGDPWCWLPNGERLMLNEFSEAKGPGKDSDERIWISEGGEYRCETRHSPGANGLWTCLNN